MINIADIALIIIAAELVFQHICIFAVAIPDH